MAKKTQNTEIQKLYVQKEGIEASIFLYGMIGNTNPENSDENLTDLEFIKTLADLKAQGVTEVHLRINSPGGYASDGLAYITAIKNSPLEIHTWNDGRAYSMAADIWLSVPIERRHMAKNSTLMIHAPSTGCYGNAKDMRETADQLDAIAEATVQMMAEAIGKTADEIHSQFYDYADHNLTYTQCLDSGFFIEGGEEEYEVEVVPTTNEPMKKHFMKYASKKFTQKSESLEVLNNTEKKEEMTTEALKTALGDGTLKLGDVEKIITEEKAKQPLSMENITKLVNDAVSPLRAENEALKVEVEVLKSRTLGNPPKATAVGNSAEAANDPDISKIIDKRETLNAELKGKTFSGDDI